MKGTRSPWAAVILVMLASAGIWAQDSASSGASRPAVTSWFTSKQVAPGTWRIDDNGTDNMYLVEGRDKALLIDTGIGAAQLLAHVKTLTSKHLMVVNTHGHSDHAGGNFEFKQVFIHPADMAMARQMASPNVRSRSIQAMAAGKTASDRYSPKNPPSAAEPELLPISDGHVFDLGGRRIEVIATPGHTPGEIVLLDAAHKLLFTGDDNNSLVWLFLPTCLPLDVYLRSLQKLEKRYAEFETLLPGHGDPLPKRFLNDQIACVNGILDGTLATEPYDSFAGKGMQARYGMAVVTFNPNNLRDKK